MQDFSSSAAIQRSLVKRFRKELWQPFVAACKRYALVPEGARVTAVRDGTSAALLASLLLEELHRHSDVPFELEISAAADEGPHPPPLRGGPPSPFRGRKRRVRGIALATDPLSGPLLACLLAKDLEFRNIFPDEI